MRNKFDEAVKNRLEHLEDTPSAGMFAAIQARVEAEKRGQSRRRFIWYASAAAVALLLTLTIMLQPGESPISGSGTFALSDSGSRTIPSPMDTQVPPLAHADTQADTPVIIEVPVKGDKGLPRNLYAQDSAPQNSVASESSGNPQVPNNQSQNVQEENKVPVEEEKAIVKDDNLKMEDLFLEQEKQVEEMGIPVADAQVNYTEAARISRGVPGAVTKVARDVFGMDTEYYEQKQGADKTTTFNADFKLFKIQRTVKTTASR